jgi:hypothetical protein
MSAPSGTSSSSSSSPSSSSSSQPFSYFLPASAASSASLLADLSERKGPSEQVIGDESDDEADDAMSGKSVLWLHAFSKGDGRVRCLLTRGQLGKQCKWDKPQPKGSTTTPLWRHLQECHAVVYRQLKESGDKKRAALPASLLTSPAPVNQSVMTSFLINSKEQSSLPSLSLSQRKHLTLLLFKITVECNLSFRALPGSPSFRQLMMDYVGWKVPSRMVLWRILPACFRLCMKGLKADLCGVDSISITTDSTYLTHSNAPFIAITGHWIDSSWALHDRALCVFPAQQSETGEFIRDQLKSILQQNFEFDNRVHRVVTDEGANFLKGADYLLQLEVVREHIRCACHRIQLAFKGAVEQKKRGGQRQGELYELLRRCQRIVNVFKNGWATTRKDVLRRWQQLHLDGMAIEIGKLEEQRLTDARLQQLKSELVRLLRLSLRNCSTFSSKTNSVKIPPVC